MILSTIFMKAALVFDQRRFYFLAPETDLTGSHQALLFTQAFGQAYAGTLSFAKHATPGPW